MDPKETAVSPFYFMTASGRKESTNPKSLERVRHHFAQQDGLASASNANSLATPPTRAFGFVTASGRRESVDEKSLERARNLFAEADGVENAPTSRFGFATASGRPETVSEKSLQRAKLLFDSDADAKTTPLGFTTAAGRKESVDPKSLERVRERFANEEAATPSGRTFGFVTASGRTESVDEKSLQRARHLFADAHTTEPPAGANFGFATASGRPETVSEESLQKVKQLFDDSDNGIKSTPLGFTTAAGRKQSVDPKSLQRARHFFAKSDADNLPGNSGTPVLPRNSPTPGSSSSQESAVCNQIRRRARLENSALRTNSTPCLVAKRQRPGSSDEEQESPVFDTSLVRKQSSKRRCSQKENSIRRNLLETAVPVVPKSGKLIKLRQHGFTRTFSDAFGGFCPESYCEEQLLNYGALSATLKVTSENADSFYFDSSYIEKLDSSCRLPDGKICIGDDAICTLDEQGGLSFDSLCSAFLNLDSVDCKLVSQSWVANHYRWIVWKLASIELKFALDFGGRQLTPERVLLQLKYRYDREIDAAERPALKKILEGDENAAKPMVLMVSKIDQQTSTVELSDGWYSVPAVFDPLLSKFLSSKTISVGTKLFIVGAVLNGSENGHDPLHLPPEVNLSLNANGVRRARWSARLGFQHLAQIPSFSIASLLPGGGAVNAVKVIVCRIYSLMYMERTDGCTIVRNERQEQVNAQQFDRCRLAAVERILDRFYGNKTATMSQETEMSQIDQSQTQDLESGEGLYRFVNKANDPAHVAETLTKDQKQLLEKYFLKRMELKQADVQRRLESMLAEHQNEIPVRKVTPFLRIRVRCLVNPDPQSDTGTVLTIYSPGEDINNILKEGQSVIIQNLVVSKTKINSITLSSTKSIRFVNCVPIHAASELYIPREVTSLSEICDSKFEAPYGEVDFAGIVVAVRGERNCDIVYFSDEDMNFIAVKFWGGLQELHLKELVASGRCVCLFNVSCRRSSSAVRLPYLDHSDRTHVTFQPRQSQMLDRMRQLSDELTTSYLSLARRRLNGHLGVSSPWANNSITSAVVSPSSPVVVVPQFKTPLRK